MKYLLLLLLAATPSYAQIPGAQPFGDGPTSDEAAKAKITLERFEKRTQSWKIGMFDVFQGDKYKGLVTFDSSDETVVSIEKIPVIEALKTTPLFWYKAVRLGETELKRHIFQPQAVPYWIIEALKPGITTITVWANGAEGPVKIDRFTIQVGGEILPVIQLAITSCTPNPIQSGNLIIVNGTGFGSDSVVTFAGIKLLSTVNSSTVIQVAAPIVKANTTQPLIVASGGKEASFSMTVTPAPPVVIVPDNPVVTPIVERLGFVTVGEGYKKLPADVQKYAKELADNFEGVSAKLAATSSMTIDQANASLKEKNRTTLGLDSAKWLPWFQEWAKVADKNNASGDMKTRDDYVTAYSETAAGLRR